MPNQPLVLVADGDPRITKLVSLILRDEGIRTVTAWSSDEALRVATTTRPDIVLLDVMLDGGGSSEVMAHLKDGRPVRIILLGERVAASDIAKGLDSGADDYITKPFHPDELAARVRAVLRRADGLRSTQGVVSFDGVEIDLDGRVVRRLGEVVHLSRTEWNLLSQLTAEAGRVVLHTELLTKAWGPEYRDDFQYLRYWVSRIRRKLGAVPGGRIKTFPGIGYMLDVNDAPAAAGPLATPSVLPRNALVASR